MSKKYIEIRPAAGGEESTALMTPYPQDAEHQPL